ncbi:colanic acid biosynthesis glycosyl transferase WcaI [Chitinophaga sp. CF118]|uniref:WcaI family glycosyltransferase n=1 Tax=Chitinophaga sp. CF118 TaxID=1884367 RepID=UPI0008E736BA|nr:WcaI family glycosyltransferase [Chitinophaga sp. CF118]SFD02979.1 colanic acid biosynthesis glycosyl transferase WcaI [Chitinophaga sp. CF118]
MSGRLLLICGNFAPEPTGTGKYSGEMIKWLADNGYDCTVITSYPYYPQWQVQAPYVKNRYWYKKEVQYSDNGKRKITVYRCPQYTPANPSGKKRIIMDLSFLLSTFFKLLQLLTAKKFDVVMTVVPSFHLGFLGVLYKKIRGAKFLYHIQDLQIETARDLGMIRSPSLIKWLFILEKYILQKADIISSISEGMISKIQQKTGGNVELFPNWVDVRLFYPLENKASLKTQYGFNITDKVILYSGAIGEKQGLEMILHTAAGLKEQGHIKFLICGSGPYKKKLGSMAAALDLKNVIFFPLQPLERFNHFLNMADVHLVIQKANAGDLVMPSKLTTIMAVGGVSVITANPGTSLHEVVQLKHIGILVMAENQPALNEGIRTAVYKESGHITRNAREYALNYLATDIIMIRFERSLRHGHIDPPC